MESFVHDQYDQNGRNDQTHRLDTEKKCNLLKKNDVPTILGVKAGKGARPIVQKMFSPKSAVTLLSLKAS